MTRYRKCAWQKNVGPAGLFNPTEWNNKFCECIVSSNCNCNELKECNEKENVCECIACNSMLALFGHDIYIYIYFISFWVGQRSAARSGQAKLKKAKPSYRLEAAKRPVPRDGWDYSVCYERRARMNSFAAVLPTTGYSSMYRAECEWMSFVNE